MQEHKKHKNIFTIGFDEKIPSHRKAIEVLNSLGRKKAQYIADLISLSEFHTSHTELPTAVQYAVPDNHAEAEAENAKQQILTEPETIEDNTGANTSQEPKPELKGIEESTQPEEMSINNEDMGQKKIRDNDIMSILNDLQMMNDFDEEEDMF